MSERLLVIPGTLPGLNEYIAAERTNRYKAAAMKRKAEEQRKLDQDIEEIHRKRCRK